VQSTTNGGKALDRIGNQEEERKNVYVQRRKYLKGMLIFIVADIWNCYNMDNKIILA